MAGESWPYEAIPADLFVTKRLGFRGGLQFTDSNGNLVYTVQKLVGKTDPKQKLLLDSSGNELVSLDRVNKEGGSWRGEYKEKNNDEQLISFAAERTVNEFNRSEFKILVRDNGEEITELEMRGSPLKRACTIYKHDSIVAQTSLMYRIGVGKLFVPRSRFRVTLFPGFHPSLVAAFVVLYFDGRKLWI